MTRSPSFAPLAALLAAVLLSGIASADDAVLVTVGGGGHRMASDDGRTFADHVAWGPCAHDKNDLMSVVYGNGTFVAVGGWSKPRVVVSPDGRDWTEIDESQFKGGRGATFTVLFVDERFYFVSQMGQAFRSPDGRTWELIGEVPLQKAPQQERVRDLAFGNGVFVGVGDFGAVSVSDDMGATWTVSRAEHHGVDRAWPDIEFGAGKFVLAGVDGYTATSTDGRTWEHETTHGDRYTKVKNLSWTGREFFALGALREKGAPDVLHSTDGVTWTTRKFSWTKSPAVVHRFGDGYLGVTDDFWKGDAKLYRSDDGLEWEPVPNEQGYSVRDVVVRQDAVPGAR